MKTNDMRQNLKNLNASMDWVRSIDYIGWNAPYAVTLNFWNGTAKENATKDITHFLNRLDAWVFKNAYRKYGKRLRRLGVFKGADANPHYHMLLESPTHLSDVQFEHKVESLWGSVRSGQTYIWIESTGQRIPCTSSKIVGPFAAWFKRRFSSSGFVFAVDQNGFFAARR